MLPVAPEVKAATQLLGLGRQRLALVVGLSKVGDVDLPAVRRDAAAVAESLRRNGYLVMARPDLSADDLRRSLAEFRQRLDPAGAGLIYIAGAGARLDGRSWLVTRSLPAGDAAPDAAALKAASLPLDELVLALQITPASLRLLVVDAATPLPRLPADWQGLATPTLPDGVMALLSAQPGQTLPRWQPPALPSPPPQDPRETTGSPFGTAFVHALLSAGRTGPQVLLETRRLTLDATGQAVNPWLGGRTDERDELGAPTIPIAQWPESVARRAMAVVGGQALEALRRSARPAQAPAPEVATPAPGTAPVAAGPAVAAGTALATAAVGAAQAGAAAVAQAEAAKVAAAQTVATQAAGAAVSAVVAAARALDSADSTGQAAPPAAGRKTPTLGDQREAVEGPASPAGSRPAQATAPAAPAGQTAPPTPPAPPAQPAPPPAAATPAPPSTPAPGPRTPAAPAAPVLNPYGYAAGDSFTYRRIDEWKGESVGLVMQVIETLQTAGDLAAREGDDAQTLDPQGRVRSRSGPAGSATFTPVEEFWWAKPKAGESRDVAFNEVFENRDGRGERRWEGEVEVGKPTRLTTSAGTFDVLPMEGSGWVREWRTPQRTRRDIKWWRTVWYSPELGHPVAIDILERDAGSRMLRKERLELVHMNTSRSVPR
ncbi:caspase family protein [Rubrivivax albus]|uniref:Peptidase C14 caspase domain-containing protein n=1 Tax=Rubrivivax albus TaxID=2499835 RepID=A0A3S2VXC8_9BURK|nr:caspase family protein [Rubrivivax albus]RVT51690.1 hypothetical protein ENE75_12835 [Rubrivivax albus]